MNSRLSILLGAVLLVLAFADTHAQFTDADAREGILATPSRALPAPKLAAEVHDESLARSNTFSLGARASQVPERIIQPVPGGAWAGFGRMKVGFPLNAQSPVTTTLANGRTLAFRATFLALHDVASGQSLLLGEITNRIGEIVGEREVIYPNCFDTINASLSYKLSADGSTLEQDVLLAEFGDHLIPKSFGSEIRIEIWTWFDADPVATTSQAIDLRAEDTSGLLTPSFMDDTGVDFGSAKIIEGRAFSSTAPDDQTPVGKTWMQIDQMNWLVESVDHLAVKPKLDLLPSARRGAANERSPATRENLIRSLALNAKTAPARKREPSRMMAKSTRANQLEFVMDFVIVGSVPAPAGIISWWPAAVGTNAYDAVSINDGTLQYSATNGVGKVGQALRFNGSNSRVRVADAANLRLTNALTIEAWVYPSNVSSTRAIVSKWDVAGGYNQKSYDFGINSGGLFSLRVSPTGTDTGATYVLSTNSVPTNQWSHVAATYDGTTLKVYLNGVLDGEGAYANGMFPGTNALGIGGIIGGSTDSAIVSPFAGLIDEPAIYNRALGDSEILAIYSAGGAGKHNADCTLAPTNIVAWWPGDGNGYDLARTNFATLSNATYESAVVAQGFSFNGTNAGVTAAADQILNLAANDDVTLEAWIQPLANSTTYGVMSIAGKRYSPNSTSATGYELFVINGGLGFQIANASGAVNFIATGDLRNGGYHHVAVTMDRDSTTGGNLYVNGTSVLTFNPTVLSGSLSNAAPFRIGVHPQTGFNGWYKGVIDEVTVYRRALTNTEITSLYSAGSAGKCKVDSDNDGLTDLQENSLGTYPNDSDSDDDGLTDGDEVFVYRTNPNRPDTDGDGVNDGIEVTQGRNPLVAGTVADGASQIRLNVFTPLK